MPAQDNNQNVNVAAIGLNMDSSLRQIKVGELSFALNAILDNFDGQEVSYQNEQGNIKCLNFPATYRVIGQKNIIEQGYTLVMLASPSLGGSEIGKIINNSCIYEKIINDPCLGFDVNFPIHKMVYKMTNCSTEVYWTDANKRRRFIDLQKLPYKEVPGTDDCSTGTSMEIDCNKLNVQPDFKIPKIETTSVDSDGEVEAGAYQFAFQYSSVNGEAYTSFYSITNPLSLSDPNKITNDFNYKVGKSIDISITNIDTTFYDYFNLVVIKTVNNITTPELVGTYQIVKDNFTVSYTGQSKTNIPISIDDIFQKFPVYDVADDIFSVGDVLGWVGLTTSERISYQQISNQISVGWQTNRTPATNGYNNPLHTSILKGYMRDEVYPLEFVPLLTNGLQLDGFHIPGRRAEDFDLQIIDNQDILDGDATVCSPNNEIKKRWQVYNTGRVEERVSDGKFDVDDCYTGPYEFGQMAYWESTELYPCNQDIWGELAGQPIRHHKFPDSTITHIHDNQGNIYPIGFKINVQQIIDAINNSTLTQEQKNKIAGFKIIRGNRANNKSVVAKGLINNVGKYVREDTTYYFPNYPYNDLRIDPFISAVQTANDSGSNPALRLNAFSTDESRNRMTFHSPDTSFFQPTLGNILKLETAEYGESKGHFKEVLGHSKYKLLTLGSYLVSLGVGIAVGFASGTIGDVIFSSAQPFEGNAAFVAYNSLINVIEKLTPKRNYTYQYNSIGEYNSFIPIPNNGNKQRLLDLSLYLLPGMRSVGDTHTINNFQREGAVYLRSVGILPYPNEQGAIQDQSRWVLSDDNCANNTLTKPISSYYASIKKQFNNQYGQIYSYQTVDTGFQEMIDLDGNLTDPYRTIWGGDTFINKFAYKTKLPFFIDNRVGDIDESDVFYNELGNVAFPTYWLSTDNRDDQEHLPDATDLLKGLIPFAGPFLLLSGLKDLFQTFFGVKKNNFDCDTTGKKLFYQDGKIYLFAYGIPHFYCESEVNVDYRQAYNGAEGDFFPRVGSDIPDEWLQEKNTSIQYDNTYTYNKSYSKQNDENYFSHLPNDFTQEECRLKYPKRLIISEIRDDSINFERRNNWLIYKPLNYFDLPQNYGNITSVDGMENRQVLVRMENKSLLYNALYTAATSAGQVYLGKSLFNPTTPPLDYADTDLGYMGSQHKFLLKTEYGAINIDSSRGQIFAIQGTGSKEISNTGVSKFLTDNLDFQIKKAFPAVNIDNHFNGIGLHGVYDSKYNRLIITKMDYAPLNKNTTFANNKFYLNEIEILLTDTTKFCNKSFTLSYDFDNRTWVSFHSYVPNYYIGETNYFFSGLNSDGTLWKHNVIDILFNSYYGVIYPYIIEYPKAFEFQDEILQNVKDYTKVLQYNEDGSFIELDDVWFNKAILGNNQQSSGVLLLTKKPKSNLQAYNTFPKYNVDSKEILFTKSDNFYQYNTFWGMIKNKKQPIWMTSCTSLFKELNQSNMDYSKRSFHKEPLRAKDLKIRHILDNRNDVKLISQFIVSPTVKSYK